VQDEDDVGEVAIGLEETEVKAKRKILVFLVFSIYTCKISYMYSAI